MKLTAGSTVRCECPYGSMVSAAPDGWLDSDCPWYTGGGAQGEDEVVFSSKRENGAGVTCCDIDTPDIMLPVEPLLARRSESRVLTTDVPGVLRRSASQLRMICATRCKSCCSTGPGTCSAVVNSSSWTRRSSSRRKRRDDSLGESQL